MPNKFHSFSALFGTRVAGAKRREKGHASVRTAYTKGQEQCWTVLQDDKD